jgi:hypothetical protein
VFCFIAILNTNDRAAQESVHRVSLVRRVAAGDYKLFSWVEVERDAWQDPEFIRPFEDKGQRITLQDGDHSTVKVTAIQAKALESAKP